MKVSLNWLKEMVDVDVTLPELANLFNTHSAEVEEAYKLVNASKLVVGHVISKEKHPDADKLSVCQVDIGGEISQIVCGAPNVDSGQTVIVSLPGAELPGGFKIKTSTIRGVESNGMICSLSELGIDKKYHNEDGIHVITNEAKPGQNALEALYLDDEVIDIDVLPNRADLLSMMGVAYDVAAMLDKELRLPNPVVKETGSMLDVSIKIDTEKCISYYARVIDNLEIKESPKWMQSRLIAAGMRPINNVVDIANYVMLEVGQPLHTFDYDLLGSNEIVVRMATENEELRTLDDKVRKLEPTDIVITNGIESVALGGVMGGHSTEIHPGTKRLLLESATFDPISIRKTSTRLDLRSEASMRFERGVDPARTIFALERATELFVKYANGTVLEGIRKVDNADYTTPLISVSLEKINQYLGSEYSAELVSETLHKLRLEHEIEDNTFHITRPTRRGDMEGLQDICEEIGRIIGYDSLPETLPSTISVGQLTESQVFERQLRRAFTGYGLSETITYSLVNSETAHDFVTKEYDLVPLKMPMSTDRDVLTLSPIGGMVDVIAYHQARKMNDVFLYELGKRYTKQGETKLICGALTGMYQSNFWQGYKQPVDFFMVKGVLEAVFEKVSAGHLVFEATSDYKNLHPGQTAYIKDRSGIIGVIGKLHPEYEKNHDVKGVYVFELDQDKLMNTRRPLKKMKDIQKFPSISRDLAIVLDKDVIAGDVLNVMNKAGKRTLENIEIFDVYTGDNVDSDKKSLACRLTFTDPKRTLETKEVDALIENILQALKKAFNATLR